MSVAALIHSSIFWQYRCRNRDARTTYRPCRQQRTPCFTDRFGAWLPVKDGIIAYCNAICLYDLTCCKILSPSYLSMLGAVSSPYNIHPRWLWDSDYVILDGKFHFSKTSGTSTFGHYRLLNTIYSSLKIHVNAHHITATASQITSLMIVHSTVNSYADQRKQQSSASLAFVRGIHRLPVNSPHKGPVTWKMFPFVDVIMTMYRIKLNTYKLYYLCPQSVPKQGCWVFKRAICKL